MRLWWILLVAVRVKCLAFMFSWSERERISWNQKFILFLTYILIHVTWYARILWDIPNLFGVMNCSLLTSSLRYSNGYCLSRLYKCVLFLHVRYESFFYEEIVIRTPHSSSSSESIFTRCNIISFLFKTMSYEHISTPLLKPFISSHVRTVFI